MGSDFNLRFVELSSEGELRNLGESGRYKYYVTRLHGVLHFVKTPSDAYSDDLVTLEALRKEFILGYRLNHPSIVRYYKFEDNKLYEEYIEGNTLRELIDNEDDRLKDPGFITDLARQLLSALEYLHNEEIVHLDIKPENILVTDIGSRIKLIDFSCATHGALDTTPGFTPEYMAPEQADGESDSTTDLFAVGKIIDELTLNKPFRNKWNRFINIATAYHPAHRFKNVKEAINLLDKLQQKSQNLKIGIGLLFSSFVIAGLFTWFLLVTFKRPDITSTQQNNSEIVAETLPVNEVPHNTVENYTDKTEVNEPAHPVVPASPEVEPSIDIERKITKLINDKCDELFSVEVYPLYDSMRENDDYKNEYYSDFINAYVEGNKQLIEYGKELSTNYPDQKEFIDERVIRTFETKVSGMLEELFH